MRPSTLPTFILAGLGRHGRALWVNREIPRILELGAAKLAGVVDPSAEAQSYARDRLGLTPDQCFSDIENALSATQPDFVIDSTDFPIRTNICISSLAAGAHVFMEKPVGSTVGDAAQILKAARHYGRKTAVNFTNHFFQDKQSFLSHLHDGTRGKLDYLFTRLGWQNAPLTDGVSHRMLLGAAIHALSYLIAMSGSRPAQVNMQAWNPDWSPTPDAGSVNLFMRMANGVRCQLESSWAIQASLNHWSDEYVRANCENGVLELNRKNIRWWTNNEHGHASSQPVKNLRGDVWGYARLTDMFIDWVTDKRADHPTDLETGIDCMAIISAGIESAQQDGAPVDVMKVLDAAMAKEYPLK